ncbi:hypothetical protein IV203_034117 [Nitzschia inconspicua]|uniref:Uncharacterized protein n=1 Tax=Nitzschia inconspicua TaxID=303405 RepID=A0A9K3Q716_9STRA|nr:hypothetical protein IV203_034117 [Nitzschia inconspicua]
MLQRMHSICQHARKRLLRNDNGIFEMWSFNLMTSEFWYVETAEDTVLNIFSCNTSRYPKLHVAFADCTHVPTHPS